MEVPKMKLMIALGAMTLVALTGTPLAAQHDHHGTRQDSSAAGDCGMMAGMHQGQMGMMGRNDTTRMRGMMDMMDMMAQDSAMMAAMRFWPQHILSKGETLGLTSEQVRKIEALAPMHDAPMREMTKDTTHMQQMRETADAVREILTPAQRTQVAALPMPCGMMGDGMGSMPHRMGGDSTAGTGHDAHHR